MLKAEKIKKQIEGLNNKLKKVQDKCKHKRVKTKLGASTGNWCPQDDCYWVKVDCLVCLKNFTVYNKDRELYHKYICLHKGY